MGGSNVGTTSRAPVRRLEHICSCVGVVWFASPAVSLPLQLSSVSRPVGSVGPPEVPNPRPMALCACVPHQHRHAKSLANAPEHVSKRVDANRHRTKERAEERRNERTNGRTDGRRQTDKRTDERTDGRTDGRSKRTNERSRAKTAGRQLTN